MLAKRRSGESTLADLNALAAEVESHGKQCPTCAVNEAWEQRHLTNLGPFPRPGLLGGFLAVAARVPPSLHIALISAIVLGAVVAFRLVFLVGVVIFAFPGLREALVLLGGGILTVLAAAAGGAAGGMVIPLTAPLRRGLGILGEYLTGILVMEAYMWCLAGLLPFIFGEPILTDLGGWKSLTVFSAAFGVLGAFMYRRNERKERLRATSPA
jgi:hypothetical protein